MSNFPAAKMSNLGELCLNFFSKSIPAKGKPKVCIFSI